MDICQLQNNLHPYIKGLTKTFKVHFFTSCLHSKISHKLLYLIEENNLREKLPTPRETIPNTLPLFHHIFAVSKYLLIIKT